MSAAATRRVIDDKYEIVGEIGRGGMSVVWLARDVRLQKMWALKEVRAGDGSEHDRMLRQAIVDEANFMKRLDHPTIPRVVDIIDAGEALYVVMDYVNGRPLSRVLAQQGHPFSQEEVVRWGIELCDVLGYLHSFVTSEGERHTIVYRDMKPSNVMLRDDDHVRLIDFGVCWERVDDTPNDGMVVGTPGYAAPEQMPLDLGAARLAPDVVVDGRADVYALGATLYSLACGHVPKLVTGEDGSTGVLFHMRPLREWNPSISEGLERIVARATLVDPGDRYQTIGEMRYDLEHFEELTQEYREAQVRKVRRFQRWRRAAVASFACAIVCAGLSAVVRDTSYASSMREASMASRTSEDGVVPSAAESLYVQAIEADPTHVEPFTALIQEVYEVDGVFTRAEEERWNALFRRHESVLVGSEGYAQLCFDAGVCYLCFYGVDTQAQVGSVLGQEAIRNAGKAKPWFERVERACGTKSTDVSVGEVAQASSGSGSNGIEDADLMAARAYLQIAQFNELKQRAAREGRAAGDEYQGFWDALRDAVDSSSSYMEGVRLRLCCIAFEAIAADDVLDGLYRKALEDGRVQESRKEVEDLLATVLEVVRSREIRRFCEAPGLREVYGPIYEQISTSEDVARKNIEFVYENPVARTEAGQQIVEGEDQ